jgi:uncharacterized Zn ribbon protein
MRDSEKIQYCPKCHTKMKYRGCHVFLCIPCKILWEKTEGDWIDTEKKDEKGKILKIFDRKAKGFKLLVKNAKR